MIPNDYKTSLLVAQQLPEFVRDNLDYQTFVTFVEAYYEWLETASTANGAVTTASTTGEGVEYGSKNLLTYMDVDSTLDGFVDYFMSDFLPYIPADALADKRKLLKIAKELYLNKGTEKSFKFLFRALYNTDALLFDTSDVVLRASDGKWIVSKSLRINSADPNWLLINNLKLFGETSKSYATVDYGVATGTKTEVYISNIQRLFESGEFVRVVDSNNLDVYFLNGEVYLQNSGVVIPEEATTLRGKVVGVLSQIRINPNNRGQFYVSGDPVIITNGLNPDVANPIGATAVVGTTTLGSVTRLIVTEGGQGYRAYPNSSIIFSGGGGSGAEAEVQAIDETKLINVGFVSANSLGLVATVQIGDSSHVVNYTNFAVAANTNSRLLDALTFKTLRVGPVGSVNLTNQGLGFVSSPTVSVESLYTIDNTANTASLRNLGILQPITIVNGGQGYYTTNTTIRIVGGLGFGAYANITVNGAGSIVSANYVYGSGNTDFSYPRGGLGYTTDQIPTVVVTSPTGSNASLTIPNILGAGAILTPTTDRAGSITTIQILNPGEDYVSQPNVSLKVADIAVSNVNIDFFPQFGDIVYQGASKNTSTYSANVYSVTKLSTAFPANTRADIYRIREFDYVGTYNGSLPVKYNRGSDTYVLTPETYFIDSNGNPSSLIRYGDGNAKATASFLDGLIVGQGKWLNSDGQLSSLGLVLESEDYNNFTYILSVEKSVSAYKDILLNLLHPSGMRMRPRNLLRTSNSFSMNTEVAFQVGYHMDTFAGPSAIGRIEANTQAGQISTNIIRFVNTVAANIGNTVFANDVVEFSANNQLNAYSTITNVDYANNQITIQDNVFVVFANVAVGSANASSNVINIVSVTGQYDGKFTDKTPANNIIFVGDSVSLNGGPYYTVQQVFSNGNLKVANSSFGPINNALITVNKSANTDYVMVYGVIGQYEYPELLTESGFILTTESSSYILAG
jgi:hypothetical protein